MSWEVKVNGAVIHVIQEGDVKPHSEETEWSVRTLLTSKCSCGTRVEVNEHGSWVIIHSSFNGREGVEWANDLLK
jgi:hypothetical protein